MSFALIDHLIQGSTDSNGFTSAAINSTGANRLTVGVVDTDGTGVLSDSKGNTFVNAKGPTTFNGPDVQLYECTNPTVGSSHTFTYTGTNKSPVLAIAAWSGNDTSASADQTNLSSGAWATTRQAGSVTPSTDNQLLIAINCHTDQANDPTIDGGFTRLDAIQQVNGQHHGAGFAYLIQTTATAANPTWTAPSAQITGAVIATFKSAAATTNPGLDDSADCAALIAEF